jgi:type III restriction enzyme
LIDDIKKRDWSDEDLTTSVTPSEVLDEHLVKTALSLGGYNTPMETAVSDLLHDMEAANSALTRHGLPGPVKAIYVSKTNIVEGNASSVTTLSSPLRRGRRHPS